MSEPETTPPPAAKPEMDETERAHRKSGADLLRELAAKVESGEADIVHALSRERCDTAGCEEQHTACAGWMLHHSQTNSMWLTGALTVAQTVVMDELKQRSFRSMLERRRDEAVAATLAERKGLN